VYARQILEHFDLAKYFTFAGGSGLDGSLPAKSDVIRYVLEETGTNAQHAVMVGDRLHDVEGAALWGIPTVGVLWGYGSDAELTGAGAAALASDMAELEEILTYEKYRHL